MIEITFARQLANPGLDAVSDGDRPSGTNADGLLTSSAGPDTKKCPHRHMTVGALPHAPPAGLEPATVRLTVECSAN